MVLQKQSHRQALTMPLAKNHSLLRASSNFTLQELSKKSDQVGDDGVTGIWGNKRERMTVANGKGDVVGWVLVAFKLFCGGVGCRTQTDVESNAASTVAGAKTSSPTGAAVPQKDSEWLEKFRSSLRGGATGRREDKHSTSSHGANSNHRRARSHSIGSIHSMLKVGAGGGGGGFTGFDRGGPYLTHRAPLQGSTRSDFDEFPPTTEGTGEATNNFENGGDFTVTEYSDGNSNEESALDTFKTTLDPAKTKTSSTILKSHVSLTLRGSLTSIPLGTIVRRNFEKAFITDISNALNIPPDNVKIEKVKDGSIIVDFTVIASSQSLTSSPSKIVEKLKKQLLNPTSPLLSGSVTRNSISVASCGTEYVADDVGGNGERDVIKGRFIIGNVEDATSVIPGAVKRRNYNTATATGIKGETASIALPVKLKNGRESKNGERDMPGCLYYYPGGRESDRKVGREGGGDVEGKGAERGVGGKGGAPKKNARDGGRAGNGFGREDLRGKVGDGGVCAGRRGNATNVIKDGNYVKDGDDVEYNFESKKSAPPGNPPSQNSASYLHKALSEISRSEKGSVLARLFVEVMSLRGAAASGRIDVDSLIGDDGKRAEKKIKPPSISYEAEKYLRQYFEGNSFKGTISLNDAIDVCNGEVRDEIERAKEGWKGGDVIGEEDLNDFFMGGGN